MRQDGRTKILNGWVEAAHFADLRVVSGGFKLGCEGIVSKRLGSPYRAGRSAHWLKIKNPAAPAVRREAEEDWSP
jgi:hypothetical protein